ncbi:hypothetical protein FQR65_LT09794 [Abscondita terminalis]|nr:hypothetical protein FQR65_LT09794 [Abscondita terminalis]
MVNSLERRVGKLAVVSGASSGIGEAISVQLVKAGVLGTARGKDRLENLSKRLKNEPGQFYEFVADFSKEEDILKTFKWADENVGPVHILINNAGLREHTNLVSGNTEFWKSCFDTNVLGLCIATREALKAMNENNIFGHIIHINSINGHKVCYHSHSNIYPASKFAVTALTETLRQELNSIGSKTKVTSISPGYVDTNFRKGVNLPFDDFPLLKSEDVADAVMYALGTPPHVQSSLNSSSERIMAVSLERWIGKLAVVSGASSGIGEAISIQLVKAGVHVLGTARGKERLVNVAERLKDEKGKFYYFVADFSKEEDILSAFKWAEENVGPVHILVNNAGVRRATNLVSGDTELWKDIIDTNVLGLCIATREALKIMNKNNISGHIIHINSVNGHKVCYNSQSSVYPASKFAVTALTETLRQELNSMGSKTKVTSISPGYVETNFRRASNLKSYDNFPALESEDVADAVAYVLGTPPHVQVHELIIKPVGEQF